MPNEFGKDWRIAIKTSDDPDGFTKIGGETSLDWKRSSQEQDISDKDSGVYGATSYGQQKITFSVSGNLKLPDPGFTAAEDASKASPPQVEVQITRGAVIKYQGLVSIGNFSATFPTSGPATWSADLSNAAAPTIDNMSAVV